MAEIKISGNFLYKLGKNAELSDNDMDTLLDTKSKLYGDVNGQYNTLKQNEKELDEIERNLTELIRKWKATYGTKTGGNKKKSKEETVKYLGGNYKVYTGPRGGKYIMHQKNKVYISN